MSTTTAELSLNATLDDGSETGVKLKVTYPENSGIWVLRVFDSLENNPDQVNQVLSQLDGDFAIDAELTVHSDDGRSFDIGIHIQLEFEDADKHVGDDDPYSDKLVHSAALAKHALLTDMFTQPFVERFAQTGDLSLLEAFSNAEAAADDAD
ncbi:hypothetical protein [Pseudoclavibacter soli]|uniref:hypothetical protein n=1 Tax=Pseudoclavibacter soli TaxID=452623 RepID=UPI0004041AEF|nr:hypothetical protein [Pseudoclavibacter soli]